MPVVPFIPAIIGGTAGLFAGKSDNSTTKGLAAPLIGAGVGITGALLSSSATKDAAKTAAESADKAAQLQAETSAKALQAAQQLYQQQRADLGPYRTMGGGAIGKLGSLWGVTPAADASLPGNPYGSPKPGGGYTTADGNGNPVTMMAPPGTTAPLRTSIPLAGIPGNSGTLGGLGGQPGGPTMQAGGVKVKAPNGQIYLVPTEQLGDALAHGGQQVNG